MSTPLIPREELHFQLFEVQDTESLCERERFADHNKETFEATLDTAEKIATERFAPHNHTADSDEPKFDGEKISMIDEVKQAVDSYSEAGFIAGRFDFDDGGMQLPESIMVACSSYFMAANPSSTAYPFLTTAAANLIKTFASEDLQEQFLPPMLSGRFSGTMALTEPHAGSGLADITTSAEQREDGSYSIKGSKIYISGGEQEITENIVHLVLAKIKGAPAGVGGISLFVVPKKRLDENGEPGVKNDVTLAGLIHKLGYRGTTSTALTFGENDDCQGFLVGKPHHGLKYMFMMMNEARLGVGFGAAVIGYRGYQYSLEYAKDRKQGRTSPNTHPESPTVNIIEHGDVKRMLLAQKAYCEGAMALCFYGARLVDDNHTATDEATRKEAAQLLDLLTPLIKSWPSEYGPKANDLAIQVLGGAGYTREYPVEQCWRDNRLNPIHEGTNGIQALDLMTRKLWQDNGAALMLLKDRVTKDLKRATGETSGSLAKELAPYLMKLEPVLGTIGKALQGEQLHSALANAQCFMNIFGNIIISWMWLRQAITAEQKMPSVDSETQQQFYMGKLQAAKYFVRWELPLVDRDLKLLTEMDNTCANMQAEWF